MGNAVAVLRLTDAQYLGLPYLEQTLAVSRMQPSWTGWLFWILQGWTWSEFIVMMCNSKRRALHDFIAGTVVLRDQPQAATAAVAAAAAEAA